MRHNPEAGGLEDIRQDGAPLEAEYSFGRTIDYPPYPGLSSTHSLGSSLRVLVAEDHRL